MRGQDPGDRNVAWDTGEKTYGTVVTPWSASALNQWAQLFFHATAPGTAAPLGHTCVWASDLSVPDSINGGMTMIDMDEGGATVMDRASAPPVWSLGGYPLSVFPELHLSVCAPLKLP